MKQPKPRYLVWGAVGAVFVAALVTVGGWFGVELPEGNTALQNPISAAVVGFSWGLILCYVRNLLAERAENASRRADAAHLSRRERGE